MINWLYSCNKSLSSSVKNNNAKHIHVQKIKNHNKSYLALNKNSFIQTCCKHTARIKKIMVVIIKLRINCIMNFD